MGVRDLAKTCSLGQDMVARQPLGLESSMLPVHRLLGPTPEVQISRAVVVEGPENLHF